MMDKKLLSLKAQVYTLDFMLAMFILLVGVVLSFKLIFNTTYNEDYNILQIEARAISDALLSSGSPADWNTTNVILPGMLTDNRIDLEKLEYMKELGYYNISASLNTRKDFYFYFRNSSGIQNISFCGFGAIPETCNEPTFDNARNVVRLDRLAVLNTSAIKMVVIVWE